MKSNGPKRWGMIFKGDGGAKQGRATGETAGTLSPERADRIWQYIKKVAPAVSGKGGSNPTYRLANVLVSGVRAERRTGLAIHDHVFDDEMRAGVERFGDRSQARGRPRGRSR